MKPVRNEILRNSIMYCYKGGLYINFEGNWCKMEMDDLKEIINRVPLEKYHKRYGRYKRLRWSRE